MAGDLGTLVSGIGGAVSSLFTSEGNAAQAKDFQGAATLAEQNAQLAAASTRIQEQQTSRSVAQSLGTTEADVAGAGFTTSGSALDILKSSAQQGALAKSLVNIQGAINENSYAAQAGAYSGEASAAKEASTAGTIGAIASIGGALISGAGTLASAGGTVAKGYDYVTSLFSGGATTETAAPIQGLGEITATDLPVLSATDSSIAAGATIDTSGIALGTTEAAAEEGVATAGTDIGATLASSVGADAADAVATDVAAAAAEDTAAAVGEDVAASAAADAAGTDILATIGDAAVAALAC